MSYRGRFAPSPTGELHAGSLVAAVASWLRARQAGGEWLVRVDDLDPQRELPGSTDTILDALERHGLKADEDVMYQSRRDTAYQDAFGKLRKAGHVFACWCSRNDLAAQSGMHRDGHCITPPQADRDPAWRIRVPNRCVTFEDAVQGRQQQNLRTQVGDFVLRRADGCWSYHLACVIDDAAQRVSEVVRGCDLLDSTPRQIFLQQLLDLPTPHYLHIPLAVRAGSGKLAKSKRDLPLDTGNPCPALMDALRFLGIEAVSGDTPDELLQRAVAAFDSHRIPHVASQPWPAFR